jgi:hypothetical protein
MFIPQSVFRGNEARRMLWNAQILDPACGAQIAGNPVNAGALSWSVNRMRAALHRCFSEAESAAAQRPNYRRPLRMQAAGWSGANAERVRKRRILWLRALRDRSVWKQAFRPTVGIGAGQILLLRSLPGHHVWLMLMIPLSTFAVAIATAAASCVRSHSTAMSLSRN